MNPTELTFWLDWYERLDAALARAEGAVVAYRDPDGELHHAVDREALPIFRELRQLFLVAGEVDVFCPREPSGNQVWPSCWRDPDDAAPLVRLVEEPAYLAQDGGLRVRDPEAPSGLCRLIDLMEAREFCGVISRRVTERCPAWGRMVPELFRDGMEKVVAEALPAFDLLPDDAVERTLTDLGQPREVMSPFLPYVERDLSLKRILRDEELVPVQPDGEADVVSLRELARKRAQGAA